MIGAGLATNPFAAARFAPGVVPWMTDGSDAIAALFARSTASRGEHQVLGAHGTGKSTLLVHLESHARRAGASVVRFRGSHGVPLGELLALRRARGPRLLLVDEAEELSALLLRAVRVAARLASASLVVTAHRDLGLTTLVHRRVDAHAARRVALHVAGDRARVPTLESFETRITHHRGNLREVLFELYDEAEHVFARVSAPPG